MNVPLCQVAQKRTMKFVRNYLGKTSAKNRQIWYSPRRNISRRDAVEFKAVSQFLSAYREWPRIASSSQGRFYGERGTAPNEKCGPPILAQPP